MMSIKMMMMVFVEMMMLMVIVVMFEALKLFSIECGKTKTKVNISLANHSMP